MDEFAEAFAGRSIYSTGDLYSGYDQFQLAIDSHDITTMRTPIGLVRMCTLPQGATNSVDHMMNAMNKVLKDCIPDITMPFLDDIPIKGCLDEEKDESKDKEGCRKFIADHIKDCDKVLVEIQAQHRPKRLKKPRTESVWTDRLGRVPSRLGEPMTRRKIFHEGYILELV